jgi:hypothetical protein
MSWFVIKPKMMQKNKKKFTVSNFSVVLSLFHCLLSVYRHFPLLFTIMLKRKQKSGNQKLLEKARLLVWQKRRLAATTIESSSDSSSSEISSSSTDDESESTKDDSPSTTKSPDAEGGETATDADVDGARLSDEHFDQRSCGGEDIDERGFGDEEIDQRRGEGDEEIDESNLEDYDPDAQYDQAEEFEAPAFEEDDEPGQGSNDDDPDTPSSEVEDMEDEDDSQLIYEMQQYILRLESMPVACRVSDCINLGFMLKNRTTVVTFLIVVLQF